MHKKHKSHKLHSIPISLCRNNCKRLSLVSYSIPLGCMVTLLLLSVIAINPNLGDLLVGKSNALTIQDEWVVTDNGSENPEKLNTLLNDSEDGNSSNQNQSDEIDDSFGGFGGDDVELSESDANAGISLLSDVTPTLAITVSDSNQTINTVQGGPTVYGSYNVSITGSNVKDYTLSIRSSSVNLTMPSGASSSTSTVSGAGGKTGNNMNANTWGYKLTETTTAESSYGTLAYASLPTSDTSIASSSVASPYNLSTSKKLVFAAKFAETAAPGLYKGSITLSLSATPAQTGQLWSNGTPSFITDMQDISSGFCKNNSSIAEGDTITLKDSRQNGTNSYKIVKLKDGNCWMQENLKLGGTSAISLTPSDTNITKNYTLPASSDSSWSTTNTTAQIRVGKTGMAVASSYAGDGKGWQSTYGNYYSWCAATAGTCSESSSDNVNVSDSICPKGWHLPSGGSSDNTGTNTGQNSEFYKLLNGLNKSTITTSPYNFPAAGRIGSDGLRDPGTDGYYWSRTSYNSANAYLLHFNGSYFGPGTYSLNRYVGYSVRCVANY